MFRSVIRNKNMDRDIEITDHIQALENEIFADARREGEFRKFLDLYKISGQQRRIINAEIETLALRTEINLREISRLTDVYLPKIMKEHRERIQAEKAARVAARPVRFAAIELDEGLGIKYAETPAAMPA